jgi:hypothetical protein
MKSTLIRSTRRSDAETRRRHQHDLLIEHDAAATTAASLPEIDR